MVKKKKTVKRESAIDKRIKSSIPFLGWIGILVAVFIVSYFLFQGFGEIEYEGLTFQKERFGSIEVYTYNYMVETETGEIAGRTLYLRNDPRYNDIPVVGEIIYPRGRKVYLSLNSTGLETCDNSSIAIATLVGFIMNNGLEIRAGVPNKTEAKAKNQSYVSCDNYEGSPVIAVSASDETSIRKGDFFCYKVNIADCNIQEAFEKFIVQSLIDARD